MDFLGLWNSVKTEKSIEKTLWFLEKLTETAGSPYSEKIMLVVEEAFQLATGEIVRILQKLESSLKSIPEGLRALCPVEKSLF